jgi:soluble P-type ATPase
MNIEQSELQVDDVENAEASDANSTLIIQPGNRVAKQTGAIQRAGLEVLAVSESGKTGDTEKTMTGSRVERIMANAKSTGKTKVVYDLRESKELTEAEMDKLNAEQVKLRRAGIGFDVMVDNSAQKTELRTHGLQRSSEIVTRTQSEAGLAKALKTDAEPTQATAI